MCGKGKCLHKKIGYRDEHLDTVLRPLQNTYDAKTAGESLILLSKKSDFEINMIPSFDSRNQKVAGIL